MVLPKIRFNAYNMRQNMKQIPYQEESSMENKLYDVTALGELLIDFTENGTVPRAILLLRQTLAELHVTFLPC